MPERLPAGSAGPPAQTRFQNRRSVGSGLDEVEGDRVRDLALQLRYRL